MGIWVDGSLLLQMVSKNTRDSESGLWGWWSGSEPPHPCRNES